MQPLMVLPLLFELLEAVEVSLLEPDWLPGAPELVSAPGPPPVAPAPPIEGPPPEPPVDPAPPAPAPPLPCAIAAIDSNRATVIVNIKLVNLLRMVLLLGFHPKAVGCSLRGRGG
jgi:hypothetical protein